MRAFAFFAASFLLVAQSDLRGLLESGRYRRAQSVAEQRLASNPNDSEANYAVSRAWYAAGDLDRALPPAERAVTLNPKDAEYHSHLAQVVGSQAEKASVFRQLGLAKRCRSELEAALALDPRHYEANLILMLYLLKAPSLFGGDKARARSIPDAIAKYDPSNGFLARARLTREENPAANVLDVYRKAAEADPKNFRAQAAYLNSLVNEAKNSEEAERRARQLIQQFPDRHEGYQYLSASYAAAGRWDEMESVLRESQKRVPDNLAPFLNTARKLLRDGKELKRAENYLNLYLAQEPEHGTAAHFYAHWLLGLVYEKQERKPEAIAQMEKSLKLKSDFADARKDLKRLRS
jgi:tetratricopeptide (TPR) repeat protein